MQCIRLFLFLSLWSCFTLAVQAQVIARLPFEQYHRLIFLSVRVNGSEPLSFIFDTGASLTMLDEARATAMKLPLRDKQRIAGADGGEGAIDVAFAKGVTLDLGGVRFAPDQVGVTSLALGEKFLGHAVDGILGNDFIRRYVIEVDYVNQVLTLHDPKTYRAAATTGETLPLRMVDGYPSLAVQVKLPGRAPLQAVLGIDTGDGGIGLGLNTHFVTRHNLLSATPTIPGFSGGLSGESRGVAGRGESLRLGGVTLSGPLIGFSQATHGGHARTDLDGFLSDGIMQRFRVVFDYSRKQIHLTPNENVGEAFEYDMSGLLLFAEGADLRTFRIHRVRPDSPAAGAGLRVGDVLLTVDGKPASQFTLFQLMQYFKQAGHEIVLRVQRGTEQIEVRLTLKRQI